MDTYPDNFNIATLMALKSQSSLLRSERSKIYNEFKSILDGTTALPAQVQIKLNSHLTDESINQLIQELAERFEGHLYQYVGDDHTGKFAPILVNSDLYSTPRLNALHQQGFSIAKGALMIKLT